MLLWAKNSEPNIVLKQSINATGLMWDKIQSSSKYFLGYSALLQIHTAVLVLDMVQLLVLNMLEVEEQVDKFI
jgi:hypothetical protein